MANHKSAIKRTRQIKKRREQNRYQKVTTRNAVKELKEADKKTAEKLLVEVISKIDKLAKKKQYHKNKAANLKSKLTKMVNTKK
jgi:small subunit ribosomal protein S20